MRNNHHPRSDAELIDAHIAGNIPAWEELLDRYETFIYRLILRARLPRSDADDVFQNVCIKFYIHLEDLRDVNRLTGWLAVVVSQEIIRWRRRMVSTAPSVSLDSPGIIELPREGPLPEDMVIAEERIRFVQQALKQSGESCIRLLSLLYCSEPESYLKIAEQLDIPVGSVGPRRARCLEQIKKILSKSGY